MVDEAPIAKLVASNSSVSEFRANPFLIIAVYIAPDGALSYTTAHSAMMPAGSLTVGWTRSISVSGGAPTVAGFSSGDDYYYSMACVVEGLPEGVWQIFMRTYKDMPNGPAGLKCKTFQIRTYSGCCSEEPQKAVAWQY